ncbi:MAG: hypothetical protein ABIX28_17310 [Vicinamibacterales bacterium]
MLDWLILLLASLTVLIVFTGGVRVVLGGLVLSARGAGRPLGLALVIAVLRLALAPRVPFLASRADDWRRRRDRLFRADADDVTVAIGWRASLAAAVGLGVVGALLLFPQLRHMDSVPDHGDPLLSMWRAGWVFHQLQGDPRGLFDANIFYPEPLTLTYSDSMLLPGLTAAPFLAAGVHPVTTYNLLLISGFLFSGIAMALLVERLTGSSAGGFVAGIVFGFYPYHFEHYSHLELQMMQWMPLALLAMHRFVATREMRYAIAAALGAAAQLYSSMYYGVFFAIYAVAVLGTLIATRRPPLKRMLMPAAIAGGIAMLIAVPLIQPYREATRTKGERSREEVAAYSATPSDYLRAHFRSALYGTRTLAGREPERALFPGLVPIALAAAGLTPPLGAVRLAYVAGLLVAFDGSLGFNGFSYPYLYDWFSPIRGLRVPARFSVLVALSLAVLAGFGVRRLMALPRRRPATRVVFGLAIAASVVNAWPVLELVPVWPEPPPVYGALADSRRVVLAEFPVFPDFAYDAPYMYFSLWHWAPMINGYSGFKPKSFELYEAGVADFPGPVSMATMTMRGVTHLTVNCGLYRGGCPELLERLDTMPELRKVAEGLWQGQPVRLYELVR